MCYLILYILATAAIIKITTFNVRHPTVTKIKLDKQSIKLRGDLAVMQINIPENHTITWGEYKKNTYGYDVMHYMSTDGIIPTPFVQPEIEWNPEITILSY